MGRLIGLLSILGALALVALALSPYMLDLASRAATQLLYNPQVSIQVYQNGAAATTIRLSGLAVKDLPRFQAQARVWSDRLNFTATINSCLIEVDMAKFAGAIGATGSLVVAGEGSRAEGRGLFYTTASPVEAKLEVYDAKAEFTGEGGVKIGARLRLSAGEEGEALVDYAFRVLEGLLRKAAGYLEVEGFTLERVRGERGVVEAIISLTIPARVYSGEETPLTHIRLEVTQEPSPCSVKVKLEARGDMGRALPALIELVDEARLGMEGRRLVALAEGYLLNLELVDGAKAEARFDGGELEIKLPAAKAPGGGDTVEVVAGLLKSLGLPPETPVYIETPEGKRLESLGSITSKPRSA
ncbi:MAG: hypothetical protein F7B17_02335 [Desulfurococcales archaeon]|nr:hypothetical protein [Desulfurococcales archaeon]